MFTCVSIQSNITIAYTPCSHSRTSSTSVEMLDNTFIENTEYVSVQKLLESTDAPDT